jgi:UDPglucose--hexose-1-phosphate uridylyltransferase
VVDALQVALRKIETKLKDPDYNFFIHTAPIKNKNNYKHYHWHIEILPKISISAGFELGTGIEITVVDPGEAARILKS